MPFNTGFIWAVNEDDATDKLLRVQSETYALDYFEVEEEASDPEFIEVYIDRDGYVFSSTEDNQQDLRRRLLADETPRQKLYRFSGGL